VKKAISRRLGSANLSTRKRCLFSDGEDSIESARYYGSNEPVSDIFDTQKPKADS